MSFAIPFAGLPAYGLLLAAISSSAPQLFESIFGEAQQYPKSLFRGRMRNRKYAAVTISDDYRSRRESVHQILGKGLFTHRVGAVHRAPTRTQRQTVGQIVCDGNPQNRPVRLPVLVL